MMHYQQDGTLELEAVTLKFEPGSDGRPRRVEGKTPLPMMAVVLVFITFVLDNPC